MFVPFYARSLVFTMPEFLERRFDTKARYILSISSLLTFIVYFNLINLTQAWVASSRAAFGPVMLAVHGSGASAIVEIAFDNGANKKFASAFAPIDVL